MSSYRLRLAKPSDAKDIADVHYSIRETGALGIFAMMGKPFLRCYYRIILNDPYELVVCAENENGKIIGFNSSTLDAKAQKENLRKHRISLAIAAATSIIRKPSLIKPLYDRWKTVTSNPNASQYFVQEGARGEYWAWNPNEKSPAGSVALSRAYKDILKALGVTELYCEVDAENEKAVAYHRLMRDEIVKTIILPDGRKRHILKTKLSKTK